MKARRAKLGSPAGSAVASAQGGAGSIGAGVSPELAPVSGTPTGGAGGRPGAPGAVDRRGRALPVGALGRWKTVYAPRSWPIGVGDERGPVGAGRLPGSTLGGLLAVVDEEELRQALIQEARTRSDAAAARHAQAVAELHRLERERGNARAIEIARDAAAAARLELTQARRQLIRSIS